MTSRCCVRPPTTRYAISYDCFAIALRDHASSVALLVAPLWRAGLWRTGRPDHGLCLPRAGHHLHLRQRYLVVAARAATAMSPDDRVGKAIQDRRPRCSTTLRPIWQLDTSAYAASQARTAVAAEVGKKIEALQRRRPDLDHCPVGGIATRSAPAPAMPLIDNVPDRDERKRPEAISA